MVEVDTVSPPREVQGQHPSSTGFRYDIEGLRGLTLLAILGFHVDMPGVGGGFVGPDIFFIISGFVITGQLWKEVSTAGTVGLRRFYGGRARRLLPVSAFVGIVTVIGSAILLSPLQLRNVIGDGIACALYVGFGRLTATWDVSDDLPVEYRRPYDERATPWGSAAPLVAAQPR